MKQQNIIQQQRDFMEACDQPRNLKNVDLYIRLIEEEAGEELGEAKLKFRAAKESGDETQMKAAITELADVAFDTIYVAAGLLNVLFDEPMEVWNEGQWSNMAKVDSKTGKVTKNEVGKVMKPEGWKPPDFANVVEKNWARIQEVLSK